MKLKNAGFRQAGLFALGILIAVVGSLPFLLLREQLRQMAALGYMGLFLACFLANASVLVPAGSTLFTVSASTVFHPLLCCLLGGAGAALGEHVSYWCGRTGRRIVEESLFVMKLREHLKRRGFLTVFLFAFLPLPVFDVAGLAAGVAGMPLPHYTLACLMGKIFKMLFFVLVTRRLTPDFAGLIPWLGEQLP